MRSNCIIFALRRWFSRGGYIVLRKSNYGWWPHMIWTPDFSTFEEFTPPVHHAQMLPPLIFAGVIKQTSRKDQIAKGLIGSSAAKLAKRITELKLVVKSARLTARDANEAVAKAKKALATVVTLPITHLHAIRGKKAVDTGRTSGSIRTAFLARVKELKPKQRAAPGKISLVEKEGGAKASDQPVDPAGQSPLTAAAL